MAFFAKLSSQVDELVEAVTSLSQSGDPAKFRLLCDSTLSGLKSHKFLRTNQFDVQKQLDGYEERFRIQNREPLADALRERLDIIQANETKWTPELLHFLLELADKPTQNTRLADLEKIRQDRQDPGLKLKWKDIAKEDGWYNDQEIWRRPNWALSDAEDGASKDEFNGMCQTEQDRDDDERMRDSKPITAVTSQGAGIRLPRPQDHVLAALNGKLLVNVQFSQFWRREVPFKDHSGKETLIPISEFQAVREVLFLLAGLRTSLFDADGMPSAKYQIPQMSSASQATLLMSASKSFAYLRILREAITRKKQESPLLQRFQDKLEASMRCFDGLLSKIQHRLIVISEDTVVSLARVLEEIKPQLDRLRVLSGVVIQLEHEKRAAPFRYLELLFDAVCMAQACGSDETYQFLGRIFYDCFRVYLYPIRMWMEEGKLVPGDDAFFVAESPARVPLHQVWLHQFRLQTNSEGRLFAPRFLHAAAQKIFRAGKSVVVLKNLAKYDAARAKWTFMDEPRLEFDIVCPDKMALAPFSELFNSAVADWIQSKYHATATTLQQVLFSSCGLWDALNAMERVYFMSDGSLSVGFARSVFNNLDYANPNWHDRFTLTEMAQEAFQSSCLDADKLLVHVTAAGQKCPVKLTQSSVRHGIPAIMITYSLSWPVRLVLVLGSVPRYQAIFTLLLQVRRAMYAISGHRTLLEYSTDRPNNHERCKYYRLRAKLLWFCELFHTYLTTLVLAPGVELMKRDLYRAEDVDDMISVHSRFLKEMEDEACLGSKLEPIHHRILDVLDLSIRLARAHKASVLQRRIEMCKHYGKEHYKKQLLVDADEDGWSGDGKLHGVVLEQPYMEILDQIQHDFDRDIEFVASALRGIARASSDKAAARWDLLAEMLEMGMGNTNTCDYSR